MKRTAAFLLTVLLAFTTGAVAEPDPNFYIFLCFGQSNMDGYGRVEELPVVAHDQHRMGIARQVGFQPERAFEVETPFLIAGVKGTAFAVDVEHGSASVSVTEGTVSVSSGRRLRRSTTSAASLSRSAFTSVITTCRAPTCRATAVDGTRGMRLSQTAMALQLAQDVVLSGPVGVVGLGAGQELPVRAKSG